MHMLDLLPHDIVELHGHDHLAEPIGHLPGHAADVVHCRGTLIMHPVELSHILAQLVEHASHPGTLDIATPLHLLQGGLNGRGEQLLLFQHQRGLLHHLYRHGSHIVGQGFETGRLVSHPGALDLGGGAQHAENLVDFAEIVQRLFRRAKQGEDIAEGVVDVGRLFFDAAQEPLHAPQQFVQLP